MGMNKPDIHDLVTHARTMLIWDDFDWYSSGQKWTSTTSGGGSSVAASSSYAGGALVLTTGASQNAIAAVAGTNSTTKFTTNAQGGPGVGTPVIFQCEINYTEGATNQAGIAVGLSSSWTNFLANSTYVLPASFTGAVVYKAPGSTLWSLHTQVGTTLIDNQSGSSCIQAGVNQRIIIYAMINANNQVEVSAMVGTAGFAGNTGTVSGTVVGQSITGIQWLLPNFVVNTTSRATPLKQAVSITGAAMMTPGVFLISGNAAGTSEVVNVDYISVEYLARP